MFSLCALVFLFFYFWENRKEASYQSNAVIGGVMLNVSMWVHVSLNVNHFVGLVHSLIPLGCWAFDTLTLGLQHLNARSSLDLVMGK
jgi:hypothetical protein